MERNYTSINLNISEIFKNTIDTYKTKNPNEREYIKKDKEESKQKEDKSNKKYEIKKILNNEYKKNKKLNKALRSFYPNEWYLIFDINNITKEKLDLNDRSQKTEEKINNKSKFIEPKKKKNQNQNNFNNFFSNDEIQNKSIDKNNKNFNNETIEKEPNDIKNFTCFSFNKIKNNCSPRNYKWILMPVKIAPNQLKQETGNCYMVSALEAMSNVPFLLTYIYEENFSSNQEKYKLTFKRNDGQLEYYIVSNEFPIENNELKYMKPLQNEAYAIIFEKVWAVIKGGYNLMDGGQVCKVLNKVLGTSSTNLYNDNMKIFNLKTEDYIKYKNLSNKSLENIRKSIQKVKISDVKWINEIRRRKLTKIKSNKAFDAIREAETIKGGIINVSINMEDGGHSYSVLGTYSEINKKTGETQDFIILKNTWRSGDDIEEKINMPEIEKQIDGFDEIIKINRNHYETGIFYMPKEYFEGWFRSISICKPNYKENFPKVDKTLDLYKGIYEFYNINSDKTYFESFHGNELIKTNIISKKNLNVLLKIIHHIKSDINFVYKNEELSTIWLDKNSNLVSPKDDKNNDFDSLSDYYFIKKNNTFIVELKEKKEMKEDDFIHSEFYHVGIKFYKEKWYVIFPSAPKTPFKKEKSENLLVNPLKNDLNYIEISNNNEMIKGILKDSALKDSSINAIMNQLENALNIIHKPENEINSFLIDNSKNLQKRVININLNSNQKSNFEKKENVNDKFRFINRTESKEINTGWVNIFNGINLCSNEYDDNHYHVHSYGVDNNTNLFNLIGKKFECSCYYLENNIVTKQCKKRFTFQKQIKFFNFTYYINGVPKTCIYPSVDRYDLEKESNKYFSIK